MKKIIFTTTILFFASISLGQNTTENVENFWETDSFAIRLTVALISSLISFIVAYFFYRRSKSKEPLKQVSYELENSNGLVEVDKKIKENIKVSYMGTPIDNLSYIKTTFENTGNKLIKNQQIRFELTSKSSFIESSFNPVPEKELSVTEETSQEINEKIIKIGHLEKGQKVSYHLVVTGENAQLKLHPFNEEGDVEFATRSATKEITDKEILKRFFLILIILIIVPEVFGFLKLGGIDLPSLIRFLLFVLVIKDLINGIRILVERIFNEGKKQEGDSQTQIDGNDNIVINAIKAGEHIDIEIKSNPKEKEKPVQNHT